MKKILVTGASGFLGRNVKCLMTNDKNIKIIESFGDLTKWEEIKKLKEKDFEEIVHMAGVVKARLGEYSEGFEANVTMMENIIRLAKIKKNKRVVFISSNSVNYRTDDYANSKRKAEELLVQSGLDFVILRPTLILGSRSATADKLKMWLKLLPAVPLPRRGEVRFSPIYPTDLARLIVKMIESKNTGRYTVGGEPISYKSYLENIAEKKLVVWNVDAKLFLWMGKVLGIKTAKGMVEEIRTDNETLKRIYNWEPQTNYELLINN